MITMQLSAYYKKLIFKAILVFTVYLNLQMYQVSSLQLKTGELLNFLVYVPTLKYALLSIYSNDSFSQYFAGNVPFLIWISLF